MSVRVHAIAKQVNKTSKEIVGILKERGYDIKRRVIHFGQHYRSVDHRGVHYKR